MQIIMADLRYTWRRVRRQPGVTIFIILLLAVGMGGLTTVFNPIYATIFTPLPFPQPDQLARIGGNIPMFSSNFGNLENKNEEVIGRIFSNTTPYNQFDEYQIRVPDTGKLLEVTALTVRGNFFETLGVKPLMGYGCGNTENGWVVSHRFWRSELMQKNDVIGSNVLLPDGSSSPHIIGVMPESFRFPYDTDIWMCRSIVFGEGTQFIGRLRPGVSVGWAAEELKTIDTSRTPEDFLGMMVRSGRDGPILESLQIYLYGDQRPMLRMLGVTAALFLLLVCAGVVNILIAQGVKRKQEIATRLIYGATRRDLVFQMLRETLPLVVIGGLAGLWLSEMASAWTWAQMPSLRGGAVYVPVKIAFWASLVMVITLIGGLIPSMYATSLDLNTYLKSATGGGKRMFFTTQELLVGVQLSLALALLIGMGLLIRNIVFNVDVPIGWSSRDIAVVTVQQPGYPGTAIEMADIRYEGLNQDIKRELQAMPEVMTVGMLTPIPFSTDAIRSSRRRTLVSLSKLDLQNGITQEFSAAYSRNSLGVSNLSVSPDGFDVLGIPLVLGRNFTEADATKLNVIGHGSASIINQAFAERLWPGENPIGKTFYQLDVPYEVIGVVRNFHHFPGNRDFTPAKYNPSMVRGQKTKFLIRLRPDVSFQNFQSNLRRQFSGFALDWVDAQPLNKYVKDATVNQRMMLNLLAWFAVLGIVVSGLAVYATAALAAKARTRETGIRMAIGAQASDILKLAFWRGIRAILLGLPFGLFVAWILARVLTGFIVDVNVGDPFAWLISCAILLVIAAVAALIPALRASRINPIDALRE